MKTVTFSTPAPLHAADRKTPSSVTLPACARVVALVSAFGFVAACVCGAI